MIANHFKHVTMISKGQTLINGRSLVTMAKLTVGYVKKAMAHASSFLNSKKQLPSGNFINDILDYILDEMWKQTWLLRNQRKNQNKLPEGDGNNEIQRKERPKDWIFFGYLTFCMFSCPLFTEPNNRLDFFCPSGKNKDSTMSRKDS